LNRSALCYHITALASAPESLVVVTRYLSPASRGATTVPFAAFALPGVCRRKASPYQSARPSLKPTSYVSAAGRLSAPAAYVDASVDERRRVLAEKFLRDAEPGQTPPQFYGALKGREEREAAEAPATPPPKAFEERVSFAPGTRVGCADRLGNVRSGEIAKAHSVVYVRAKRERSILHEGARSRSSCAWLLMPPPRTNASFLLASLARSRSQVRGGALRRG
jgi:hypothetical protein